MPSQSTQSVKSARIRSKAKSRPLRDADVTQAEILDAAEEEFAQHGFNAAKTESIVAKTGVTKSMIYYYYASKEGLYKAVLERAFVRHLQPLQQLDVENLPPDAALETLLREFLRQLSSNLNLATLLFQEATQNKGKYYPKEAAEILYGTIRSILERGMEAGCFRSLNACHTAVNIVGTCVFYFNAHENLKFLWKGKRLLSKEMVQQHTQEAIDLILAGVKPNSFATPSP